MKPRNSQQDSEPQTVDADVLASGWHTAALVFVIVAVALTGSLLALHPPSAPVATTSVRSRIATVYAPMVIVSWGMLAYVCRVGRTRSVLATLVGRGWYSAQRAFADLALALACWIVILGIERTWAWLAGRHGGAAVAALLPHSWTEKLAWVVVSMSVGFCEEVIYRGYLQTQLSAFTKRPPLGIALQAVLFGIAHAEQGAGAVLRLALYGVGLGMLARWRRSLWPGVVAHVWTNVASGLFG